ncbi:hypothetical protein ACROYT_G001279 [Oculina patagonica]
MAIKRAEFSVHPADRRPRSGELPSVKTWVFVVSHGGLFKFQVNLPTKSNIKKRSFLRKIATLFDPLGLLSPYTIRAKVVIQEMWASGVDWDEPVDRRLSLKATQWFDELSVLPTLHIPRCLRNTAAVKSVTLHTFVDASQEAYGAACYTRHLYEDESVSCCLVASKSRVAPLQAVSIPRLELMAAVVGLKLSEKLERSLPLRVRNGGVGHVPKQDSTEWPETKIEVKKGPDIEVRKQYQEAEQTEGQTFLALTSEDRLQPQRYSSWSKLTRVTASVDRFLENCRLPAALRREGALKPDEVSAAEMRYIRQAQQEVFAQEIEH